jgi:hypothetical protein
VTSDILHLHRRPGNTGYMIRPLNLSMNGFNAFAEVRFETVKTQKFFEHAWAKIDEHLGRARRMIWSSLFASRVYR